MTGTLFLLPCPIAADAIEQSLPEGVQRIARGLSYFLAEDAKTTRAFLKAVAHPRPLRELDIVEIGHAPASERIEDWLRPLLGGQDGALVSEAGCPAVADPGATLVAAAHARDIRVRPLVGPSSLLLALMASGLNGQRFRFCGYLPVDSSERARRLQALERDSRSGETQAFIETPYRGSALFESILATCAPTTRVTLAIDLTGVGEYVKSHTVAEWKHAARPPLERRPAVFLLLA